MKHETKFQTNRKWKGCNNLMGQDITDSFWVMSKKRIYYGYGYSVDRETKRAKIVMINYLAMVCFHYVALFWTAPNKLYRHSLDEMNIAASRYTRSQINTYQFTTDKNGDCFLVP